jgi:hypothetical protein
MMDKVAAFERMLELLADSKNESVFVTLETLSDMGVNPRHLEETSGRAVRRRNIVVKGSDGLPMPEVEFEFLPKVGK